MGTGYTRNDTANNIADGNVINAADFDGEYDAIEAAFNSSTGHTHDGTSAEGAPITVLGPSQEFVASSSEVKPSTNAGLDLGTSALKFKDLYIDGVAYIDGFGGDILAATDKKIQFRDTALFINSSADGQLDIDADTTIELNSPEVIATDDFRLKSDAAILTFGADNDVTVTHVADTGLDAKAASGFNLKLQTGDTTVEDTNTIGKISFNAPDEASGTDAILVGAEIEAAAEATFSSTVNSTALVFKTNDSAAATERFRIKSNGDIVIKGDSYDVTWDASADAFITDSNNDIKFQPHGTGAVAVTGALTVDNIKIDGNTISSTDTNGDINLTPNGTGNVVMGGLVATTSNIKSTDAGSAKGPQLDIFRDSASPADGDAIGYIDFSGDDSGNNKTVYASILATAADVTDTTEDGTLQFNTMVAGTDTTTMTLKESKVGIGTSSPSALLTVGDGLTGTKTIALSGSGSSSSVMDLDFLGGGTGNPSGRIRYSSSTEAMTFHTGDLASIAEAMRINSSGKVLTGLTSSTDGEIFTAASDAQASYATTASEGVVGIVRYNNTSVSNQHAGLFFRVTTNNSSNNANASIGLIQTSSSSHNGKLYFNIRSQSQNQFSQYGIIDSEAGWVFNDEGKSFIDFRVESDNNANMLYLDAGQDRVGIATSTGVISSGSTYIPLVVQSNSNADAIAIKGRSADDIGELSFYENDASTQLGNVQARTDSMRIRALPNSANILLEASDSNGDLRTRVIIKETETLVNDAALDHDFRVKSDNNSYMFYVDAQNDRVKIGGTGGGAKLNVNTGITATDPQFADFRNTTSGQDCRVILATVANSSGDPYIKFDAGGSNFIVGLNWQGTTNNELRMGAADRPNETIKGIRVDGNGAVKMSTTDYDGQLDTSDTGEVGLSFNSSSGTIIMQRDQNSTGAETMIVNNIHSVGADIGVLQYRTRNVTEGSLNGTSSGLAITNISDYRKKENVVDATGCLDKINGLRPVTYTHRSEYDSDTTTVHTGFIAHEVSDYLPSIVKGTKDAVDEDGNVVLQSLSYADHEMIANLVGAIKELKAENDAMRLRLDALEGA